VSRRACPYSCCRIAQELVVDGVGEASFEAAQCFSVALAGGSFSSVVRSSGCVAGDLGDRHGVQTVVELAVSGAGQAVVSDIPGGGLDRGGAGVGGERGGRPESVHGSGGARILAALRVPMPASSVRVLPEVSTAASMSRAALAMRRSSWRISVTRWAARLRSVLAAWCRGRIWRRMSAARAAVRPRGAPAGVRWVRSTCRRLSVWVAGLDQVVAVFHQGTQGGDCGVDASGIESGRGHCGDTHRDHVGFIGFAAMPGGQHPDPGSEFGQHIGHLNAVGSQPLCQWG
jgi:hypothetical protein